MLQSVDDSFLLFPRGDFLGFHTFVVSRRSNTIWSTAATLWSHLNMKIYVVRVVLPCIVLVVGTPWTETRSYVLGLIYLFRDVSRCRILLSLV